MSILRTRNVSQSARLAFWSGVLIGFTAPAELFMSRPSSSESDEKFDSFAYAWHSVNSALCDAFDEAEVSFGQAARQATTPHPAIIEASRGRGRGSAAA